MRIIFFGQNHRIAYYIVILNILHLHGTDSNVYHPCINPLQHHINTQWMWCYCLLWDSVALDNNLMTSLRIHLCFPVGVLYMVHISIIKQQAESLWHPLKDVSVCLQAMMFPANCNPFQLCPRVLRHLLVIFYKNLTHPTEYIIKSPL